MKFSGSSITPAAIYGDAVPGSRQTAEAVIQAFLKRASQPPTPEQYKLDVKLAIESWPEAVRKLSFRSFGFEITAQQRDWLASIAGECSPGAGITESDASKRFASLTSDAIFLELAARAQTEIDKFESAPFFKFGTRAPKDSPYFAEFGGRVPCGEAVICNIATSWRAFEDLAIAQTRSGAATGVIGTIGALFSAGKRKAETVDHLPWMWFREFAEWAPHQEFRCFMRDRQFVGATQYHGIIKSIDGLYESIIAYPELVNRGYEYEARIKRFFDEEFLPATEGYLQGCVFDLVVDLEADRVILIELNPAAPGTFPGLKSWSNPACFNGELDWADPSYLPDSRAIHIRAEDISNHIGRHERQKP